MMHGSWYMKSNRQNLFSCWTIFCPFTPLTTQKILKKWEEPLETSFYISVPTIMIICYTLPEIWCMRGVIVIFHFGLLFALIILHMCAKNYDQMMYSSSRAGQMVRQEKQHLQVGAPPKNIEKQISLNKPEKQK